MRRTTTAILIGVGLLALAPFTITAYKAYAADAAHGASCSGDQTEGATACNVNGCFVCTSGSWVTQPFHIGASSLTCDSSHAGLMRYNSGAMEYCNGTAWTSFSTSCSHTSSSQLFTSSGTWTPPSTVSTACPLAVRVVLVGGGGGGGAKGSNYNWGYGGGSGFVIAGELSITSTAGVAVTVGSGGSGAASESGYYGTNGTASTFGAYLTASGGWAGWGGSYKHEGPTGYGGSGGARRGYGTGCAYCPAGENGGAATIEDSDANDVCILPGTATTSFSGMGHPFVFPGQPNAVQHIVFKTASFLPGLSATGGGGGLLINNTGTGGSTGGTGYGGGGFGERSGSGGGAGSAGAVFVEW